MPETNEVTEKNPEKNSTATKLFESMLWNSRLIVLVAVVSSLIMGLGIFYVTVVEVYFTMANLVNYHQLEYEARSLLKSQTIAEIVSSVDGFLIGTIMLIFALGLYELFISEIDFVKQNKGVGKVLSVTSLDDLKDKLAKVILMVLLVMFFEQALFIKPDEPMELLHYGLAIMVIALSLFFAHKAFEKKEK